MDFQASEIAAGVLPPSFDGKRSFWSKGVDGKRFGRREVHHVDGLFDLGRPWNRWSRAIGSQGLDWHHLIGRRGLVHVVEHARVTHHAKPGVDIRHGVIVGMLDAVGLDSEMQRISHACPPVGSEAP